MIGFAGEEFQGHYLALYKVAVEFVALLPETDEAGMSLRCHEVARIVDRLLRRYFSLNYDWKVLDGYYVCNSRVDHSWLQFDKREVVIDPYAIGRMPMVQMVYAGFPFRGTYVEDVARTDIRDDVVKEMVETVWRKFRRP